MNFCSINVSFSTSSFDCFWPHAAEVPSNSVDFDMWCAHVWLDIGVAKSKQRNQQKKQSLSHSKTMRRTNDCNHKYHRLAKQHTMGAHCPQEVQHHKEGIFGESGAVECLFQGWRFWCVGRMPSLFKCGGSNRRNKGTRQKEVFHSGVRCREVF